MLQSAFRPIADLAFWCGLIAPCLPLACWPGIGYARGMTTVSPQEGVSAPPRHPGGRPTKFTPETCTKLLDAIRRGFPMQPACQLAGVHYATFREWMLAGEAGDPQFAEFSEAVHTAEAEAEHTLVGKILDASDRDWRPAGWILARRFPDRWAEQSKRTVQHTGAITVTHEHLLTGLDLDAVRGLLQPPTDPTIIEGESHEVDESTP